ncbi:prenyltransferase/squalene oxidase repeat-containing protein [Kitasatospora aburaviensis]
MLTAARLGAAALTAALLTGTAAAPALADSPSPSAAPATPEGLYGKGDPTYDGVWRQSLALTALAGAKATPADSAVSWLTGQQCADGGWPSFRADTAAACDAKTEDSNATAVAVQALIALGGHQGAVDKGVQWLKANQNADGSWAYNPGSPGDANSTGLAVNALFAAKADPAGVAKAGKNAFDGLALFQLGCAAPPTSAAPSPTSPSRTARSTRTRSPPRRPRWPRPAGSCRSPTPTGPTPRPRPWRAPRVRARRPSPTPTPPRRSVPT